MLTISRVKPTRTTTLCNVRKPKADTGPFSYASLHLASDGHVSPPRYFGWRLPPTIPFTVAGMDVDPRLRIAVEFRGSAARVVAGRRAVVFAGLRDAVALLRLEGVGRRDRLLRRECDGRDGRSQ